MKQSILKSLRFFSKDFDENKIFFSEHHLSHAASAIILHRSKCILVMELVNGLLHP